MNRHPRLQMAFGMCIILGQIATTQTEVASAEYADVTITGVPHVQQKPDFCGEACVEMYLRKLGRTMDQDFVFDQSGLDPAIGRGCYTRELIKALSTIGFRVGDVFFTVSKKQAETEMQAQFRALYDDLERGIPSIVCTHYDDRPNTTEHFRLVLGYDAATDEVIYHEPAIKNGGYRRMSRESFLELWPLKYREDRWTVIRLRLDAGRLVPGTASRSFTNADYAQHILKLKKRLPGEGFHIVIQKPFVIIGNESKNQVQRRADQTVKWAVDRLKEDYFKRDPDHILDIWLFKDKETYGTYNVKLFGKKPTTPYGFYSRTNRALVMDISTGGGTLVHEIVHPFMESNFSRCPAWFNEGLASLYEQCGDRDGKIWGKTNWRLRGLQEAIVDDRVPSFETLCKTTTNEFYGEDPGTNYSQARYLCYYLQERGLLRKYYHAFRQTADKDATGFTVLVEVLDEQDMDDFLEDWQRFVLRLRF